MDNIKIVFEQDVSLDQAQIVIRAPERDATVEKLISEIQKNVGLKIIATDEHNMVRTLHSDDIILISSHEKKSKIMTDEGLFYSKHSLQSIEEMLDPKIFIRISRYEIMNLTKVKHYDFTLTGTLNIEFENGAQTWASRRCIPVIREKLREGEK